MSRGSRPDLTGRIFSKLTVLEQAPSRRYGSAIQRFWLCRCECGETVSLTTYELLKGRRRSCRCSLRRGCRDGDAALHKVFADYRYQARTAGRDFSLTLDEVRVLTSAPCDYCGVEPGRLVTRVSGLGRSTPYRANGIDRVDNTRGYTPENCVPCCWECNRLKKTRSREAFLAHVARIAHHCSPEFSNRREEIV